MLLKSVLAIVACFLTITSAVAEDPELGPIIGSTIPHDLNIGDQPGFAALAGDNGMVLFFTRSVVWCPFCKNQIINISSRSDEFEARGLALVFLSYDTAADQAKFKVQKSLNAHFISDTGSDIIDAFGLRNENYPAGSFANGVPYPAVFFIDPDRTIRGKLYEKDYSSDRKSYKNRPPFEIILDESDRLASE